VNTLDKKVIRAILGLKSQSITIALVVASGIAMFIASRTAYDSLWDARDKFYANTMFADGFASSKPAPEILERRIRNIPGIQDLRVRIMQESVVDFPEEDLPSAGRFVSITEGMNELTITEGRQPVTNDEVVLSESFARANRLSPGKKIAVILEGKQKFLNIVGLALSSEFVYIFRSSSPLPDPKHFGILWMRKEALEAAFQMQGAFNDLIFTFSKDANRKSTLKLLDQALEGYGGLGAYDRDKLPSHSFLRDEFKQLKTTAYLMPMIFLGVAAFLLHIVSTRIISKEREQIATLKAVGYSNLTVAMHYVKLLTFISSGGAILGILLGIYFGDAMLSLYGEYYQFPNLKLVIDPTLIFQGFAIGMLSGIVGALFSVMSVLKLNPAQAMRPPMPESFSRIPLERIMKYLPTQGKMILRNLFQKPFRTILSSLGISTSVMIMVIGTFMYDAVDNMLELQFDLLQRESVTINFFGPVSANVELEIAKEKAVLFTEGYRLVPIRIRSGSLSKEILLQGIPKNAELRRLIGEGEKILVPPDTGILLNSQVAQKLSISIGQEIQLEILEGNRKKVNVVVEGIVTEILGQGAYMERKAVNKLLGESESFNLLALRTDAKEESALLHKLKSIPKIAGVNTRAGTLKVFHEMTSRSMLATTLILLIFASVIAIGVVYNTAMIALSERAFELGSLRILGFNKREVFSILAGELTVETIVALPIGCVTGYWFAYMMFTSVETEGFNVPLNISLTTYGIALLTTISTSLISFIILYFKIKSMDLISILKVRE
jgi:putative ABC transport system permease protein